MTLIQNSASVDPWRSIIQLTRWKEHLPFASLTFMGGLMAFSLYDTPLDWRLLAVAMANFLAVSFAFMINDIEDAEDDARNPISARRNPITNGSLDLRTAWIACALVVAAAFVLYTTGGSNVLTIGLLNLILSFFYSWKPVRLKSSTIGLDIVSHTLMLGGLLPLAGYLVYASEFTPAIVFLAGAATLGSTYGQIYNQLRDYDSDRVAGIVNLTIRLGPAVARFLMYLAILMAALLAVLALRDLRFPSWAFPASAVAVFIGLVASILSHTDASGKPPLDVTGRLQNGFWVAFNLLMALFVLWATGVL